MTNEQRRICITIEYDGTDYAGWQRQKNAVSVQQILEETLCKLTNEPIAITGASRTDSGVHALGQVAHFDTHSSIPPEKYSLALNSLLPSDIRVRESREVSHTFHARFHAVEKEYSYQIANTPSAPAIGRQYAWHVPKPLHIEAMQKGAAYCIGTHDFSACMAAGGDAKTFVRTIHHAEIRHVNNHLFFIIRGNGFLYNMVRILAGTLVYIGLEKLPADCIEKALLAGDRLLLGPTAPPHGLTLVQVFYTNHTV